MWLHVTHTLPCYAYALPQSSPHLSETTLTQGRAALDADLGQQATGMRSGHATDSAAAAACISSLVAWPKNSLRQSSNPASGNIHSVQVWTAEAPEGPVLQPAALNPRKRHKQKPAACIRAELSAARQTVEAQDSDTISK